MAEERRRAEWEKAELAVKLKEEMVEDFAKQMKIILQTWKEQLIQKYQQWSPPPGTFSEAETS